MAANYDCVIAGGNFAGLALARALSQGLAGSLRIAVVDRSPPQAPRDDPRAFAIWAGARSVLQALGVWTAIEPHAQAVTAIEITDSAATDAIRETRLNFEAQTSAHEPAAHIVPAAVLQRALLDATLSDNAITWITGEAETLHVNPFVAEIGLADGRRITCALCVAADGRRSRLRDAAGIKTIGRKYDQTGIIATVRFSRPHGGVAVQHFLPGGPFAILPLPRDCACITWSARSDEAARLMALDDAAFLAELDQRIAGRFGEPALVGPRASWPLDIKLPRALIAERFALIGDAAHGVHPIAGQGVNLALRDVAALTESVADQVRIGMDLGHANALERYQRWRRFDSTMSAALYDGLNAFFGIDNAVLRAGRGASLAVLDSIGFLKQAIIDEASGVTGDAPKLTRGEPV